MKVRYRRASGHTHLWVGTLILGMAVGLGIGILLSPKLGGLAYVVSTVIFGVSLWLGKAFVDLKHRRRRAAIRKHLEGQGYTYTPRPAVSSFGLFDFLSEWTGWHQWITDRELKWVARTDTHLFLEREFITGDGDALTENHCTMAFVIEPAFVRLRGLQLTRAFGNAVKERRQWAEGGKVVELGDASFDSEWIATREGDAPVERELTAAVRQALSRCPQGESWYFGNGWARCTFIAFLDCSGFMPFAQHVDEVAAALRANASSMQDQVPT